MVVVYEQEGSLLEFGPRTLVFETQTSVFRLEDYPEGWRRMADEELLSLRFPHA